MTKAEFLHLNAGTQRWVLLRVLHMLWRGMHPRAGLCENLTDHYQDWDNTVDYAAQEEVITP